MLSLHHDLQRNVFVRSLTDTTEVRLPIWYAGDAVDLTYYALQPTGDPSAPYTVKTLTSLFISLTYEVAMPNAATAESIIALLPLGNAGGFVRQSDGGMAGRLTLTASVQIDTALQFAVTRLAADATWADGAKHIEERGTLRNPAAPITVPPGLDNIVTTDQIDQPGGVAGYDALQAVEAQVQAASPLTPTPIKVSTYTAVPGDLVLASSAGTNFNGQLPAAPADKTHIAVKLVQINPNGAVYAQVQCGAGDTFNLPNGPTTLVFKLLNQRFDFTYDAPSKTWAVTDSSPVSQLDARYLPPPAARTLYASSSWSNLADFSVVGLAPAIVNGAIRIAPTVGGNFDAQRLVLPTVVNADARDLVIEFKPVTLDSNSFGIGIGWISSNPWYPVSISVQVPCTGSGTVPNVNLWQQASGSPSQQIAPANVPATGLTISTGDRMRLAYRQRAAAIAVVLENLTTGASFTRSVTCDLAGVGGALAPNSSQACLFGLGGYYDVTSIVVRDATPPRANLVVIGDSKTVGLVAGSQAARWATLIGPALGPIGVYAGNGDRTVEAVQTLDQVLASQPAGVLLAIGRNDLASGVAASVWQANYALMAARVRATGAPVSHLLPVPETSLADQSALTKWINANFPADIRIDPSANWNNSTDLAADNVHPNGSGHGKIADAVLATLGAPLRAAGGGIPSNVAGLLFCATAGGPITAATGAQVSALVTGQIAPTGGFFNGLMWDTALGPGSAKCLRIFNAGQNTALGLSSDFGITTFGTNKISLSPNLNMAVTAYDSGGAFVGASPADPGAGNLEVVGNVIQKSANGTRRRLVINNDGTVTSVPA